MTTIYSFFGPPGCGKGTVASRLIQEFGFTSLSTGNLFRSHIQDQTKIGKELKKYIDAGQLVPDELVNKMVVEWLKENLNKNSNIILDGYPRTKGQAIAFQQVLKEDTDFSKTTFKIINFYVPEDEIVRRLSSRVMCSSKKCQEVYNLLAKKPQEEGVCDKCGSGLIKRKDDEENVVRERLKVFAKFKDDLIGFYKESKTDVVNFEPKGSPAEVFEVLKKEIINK